MPGTSDDLVSSPYGWSEAKIVTVFSLVTLLGCIGAALLVIYA